MVSSTHCTDGAIVAMMQVLVLPPSESRSRRVSLESLHLGAGWLGQLRACVVSVAAVEAVGALPRLSQPKANLLSI
jgi:hypothetical protein